MQRTEEGKSLRKAYESHEIKHGFNEFREPVVRTDGMINTISTVQKDNLLIEREREREREREQSQSTSRLTNQEQSTEQIVSRQDTTLVSPTSSKMVPVLLSAQGTRFEKKIDICNTLMARDYKGMGNQSCCGVITYDNKDK